MTEPNQTAFIVKVACPDEDAPKQPLTLFYAVLAKDPERGIQIGKDAVRAGAEKLPPETQGARAMVADAKAVVDSAKLAARSARTRTDEAAAYVKASKATLAKAVGKLGADNLTPEEQRRWFIEAPREAGASEVEAAFDAAPKRIAKVKPTSS
ncbi:hypothetical protein MKK75_18615 [Methylobacterium sp. J-030]|uniref:hypothetical protein n=1 Tax=Methylobacterium sp. J-030 TaxID=2836627 RepID=UPI001FB8C936|nr:hypothetical protein [Methylobacterium sp. J-030]MCJ2070779.1 hypothetical protein [Methylobacterium sp. J-030]